MKFKRFVVWAVICSFTFARTAVFAQSHEQGVAAGNAANTVIRGLVNTPSATTVVPGYTTTPPEAAYASRASLGADANAKLAACASTPTDPTCQALLNAVTSANTARPTISASDPAVAAASRIARNPSTDLGSLAAYYSGCSTTDVAAPARTETRTCSRYANAGSYSCSNLLTVGIERSSNCTPGDWFASAGWGSTSFAAQCLPDRPDRAQHFRVTDRGNPLAFFNVDMTHSPVFPQKVATIGSSGTSVFVVGRSCTASTCSITALIAEDERTTCFGTIDSWSCDTVKPFLELYSACPAGMQSGDNLVVQTCSGGGDNMFCTSSALDTKTCYAQSASFNDIAALDVTGTYWSPYWRAASTRSVVGWTQNAAYGPIPSMPLTYTKARTTAIATDAWNNQCPTLAGGARCALASAPRCIDGPSTKVIDGLSITRDCWEYQSTMACGSTVSADQCAPLAAAGCTALASTCAQTNAATGVCEVFRDQYNCTLPAETTTKASNCPSNVFCLGTSCFNIAYTNDADFGRSMSMLEAAREAGVYLDTDRMQVFKGEADSCRNRLLTNCCSTDPAGRGMSNQSVFGTGSSLVYDVLMNSENREFLYQGLSAMLTSAGFSGTFSAYGFTVAVNGAALPAGSTAIYASSTAAGEGFVVAFDPWSLVIMIIIYIVLSMMECNAGESRLALKEGAALCHTIGNYCSSCTRILGVCVSCVERTTGKCCFNSMIARIINQQGRAQVGKGWGSAQGPDCSGFTVAQLQRLDFAAMDLSEFYASLIAKNPNLATLQENNASRIPACYFGQGKC